MISSRAKRIRFPTMKSRSGLLLRLFCLWTLFVFGVLIKNMITDTEHSTAFRLVHSSIGAVSIGFALASWPLAKRLDRKES